MKIIVELVWNKISESDTTGF